MRCMRRHGGVFLREFTFGHANQLAAVGRAHPAALAQRTPLLPGIEERVLLATDSRTQPGSSARHRPATSRTRTAPTIACSPSSPNYCTAQPFSPDCSRTVWLAPCGTRHRSLSRGSLYHEFCLPSPASVSNPSSMRAICAAATFTSRCATLDERVIAACQHAKCRPATKREVPGRPRALHPAAGRRNLRLCGLEFLKRARAVRAVASR